MTPGFNSANRRIGDNPIHLTILINACVPRPLPGKCDGALAAPGNDRAFSLKRLKEFPQYGHCTTASQIDRENATCINRRKCFGNL
jgi:hypothetical protein